MGACTMLAGCNLLSGAADLITAPDDAGSAPEADASPAPDGGTVSVVDGAFDAKDSVAQPAPDATRDGADAADAAIPRPDGGRFVFVTSAETTGDLMGLAGADARCAAIATSAGLGGAWVAWVSTSVNGALARLTSAGPWYLVSGALVAASKTELAAGSTLQHPIDHDERGTARVASEVWTGGFAGVPFPTCNEWTSATVSGETGSSQSASGSWQQAGLAACSRTLPLYCFEN